MSGWFDSHCHPELDRLDEEVHRAQAEGVDGMIVVGTTNETSKRAVTIVRSLRQHFPGVVSAATVGIHPHDSEVGSVAELEVLLGEDAEGIVVGVGECGLDYFYDYSPRQVQRAAFEAQIDIACRTHKTLVIHTRDAWDDTFEILRSVKLPERVVFHCFIGGEREMQQCVELGGFLSFSGVVTFKNSDELRMACRQTPLDRILIETDAPYLAPVPMRGKRNESANVAITGRYVAELRNLSPSEFQEISSSNVQKAFQLPPLG